MGPPGLRELDREAVAVADQGLKTADKTVRMMPGTSRGATHLTFSEGESEKGDKSSKPVGHGKEGRERRDGG